MLFNAHSFIFIFLPITLVIYHWLSSRGHATYAISSLIIASLTFYGWWEPRYLLLILSSVAINFAVANGLMALSNQRTKARKVLLAIGVTANLGALAWFKYANFLVDSGNDLLGADVHLQKIILPLAISFFTFQQIAYLVDTYRGLTNERSFLRYALFVTFFPQLIAGPIVHHKEMLPQFNQRVGGIKLNNLIIGGTIFLIGLFKKVIIADGVSPYSDTVFAMAANGDTLTFLESWTGALAYSIQLYFDFSGYSDMAIGLARMFGVKLPLNFNSPYKSRNIIDFWRRWHMTLSRFLRDYLYFSLGGNRNGASRTYINLMIVMLLGGLWHGAGWTFVLWGALHGFYLLINHGLFATAGRLLGTVAAHLLTLVAIIVAWVLFRAESLDVAGRVLAGMAGVNGVALPIEWLQTHASLANSLSAVGVQFQPLAYMGPLFTPLRDLAVLSGAQMQVDSVGTITALLSLSVPIFFALFWPNTQQIMHRFDPAIGATTSSNRLLNSMAWRMNIPFAILTAAIAAYACFGSSVASQFLYFQF
ncbi:UNVERIFIED_CONTAM: hypothetical protein GTU68_015388 [Idotea baltica]|nr:hypothetical protein [Idotea baltica]